MLLDLINPRKLRRALVYILLAGLVFIAQDLLVSRITILGVKAMIVPALVAAVGLYEGASWGGFLGLGAGWCMDLGYTEHTVLFLILFTVLGFGAGVLGKYFMQKGLLPFLTLFAVCMIIITAFQALPFLIAGNAVWPVLRTALIQIAWSLPWAVPVYYPCRAIAAKEL